MQDSPQIKVGRWRSVRLPSSVAAVLALVLALASGQVVEGARQTGADSPPLVSWLMFGVAGGLLAFATPSKLWLVIAQPTAFWGALRSLAAGARSRLAILVVGSLACWVGALAAFVALNSNFANPSIEGNWFANNGSWLLYIASLLLFVGLLLAWEHTTARLASRPSAPDGKRHQPIPRLVWGLVGGLTLIALALRLVNLDQTPPGLWWDEAQNGIVGHGLLQPGAIHHTFVAEQTQMGALYFYVLGAVQRLVGSDVWQVRLVSSLAGAALVPMLFALGSRLYGWGAGLAAAGLLSVSAWNLTFSRIGMASLFTVALDVATYLCLLQGLRTGRLIYYGLGGVLLGFALQAYYIGRLVPIVLIIVLGHLLVSQRLRFVRAARQGILVFAIGAILAATPILTFALQQGDVYNARIDTVSIFSPQGSQGRPDALQTSVARHLQMFNFRGDQNPRHNLPGEPALGWVAASLFWAGLFTCLMRAKYWHYFFPLIWWIAGMSGGIFSLLRETPHAHRTLENSVVTALVAGLFLGAAVDAIAPYVSRLIRIPSSKLVRSLEPNPGRTAQQGVRAKIAGTLAIFAVVAWSALVELPRYFSTQANSAQVWSAMNAPQLQSAREVARYADKRDVYASVPFFEKPFSYLYGDAAASLAHHWEGLHLLPLTTTRDSVLVLDPPNAADLAYIKRLYPQATIQAMNAPSDPGPLLHTVLIRGEDMRAIHGVHATLYRGSEQTQDALHEVLLPTLEYTPPPASLQSCPCALRLSTTLKVDVYGPYGFQWEPNSGVDETGLSVDGHIWQSGALAPLAIGLHNLVLTATLEANREGQLDKLTESLVWTLPNGEKRPVPPDNLFDPRRVEPYGLTGVYRQGTSFDQPADMVRIDPVISFSFEQAPLPRPFTVEWSGGLYVPQSGEYTLGTEQVARSKLYVDGKELLTNETNKLQEEAFQLTKGWHDVRLQLEDGPGLTAMYLNWTPPGGHRAIVPSAFLRPRLGGSPAQSEEGTLPGLEDADGTRIPTP